MHCTSENASIINYTHGKLYNGEYNVQIKCQIIVNSNIYLSFIC